MSASSSKSPGRKNEPRIKRAISFFDGQNLHKASKSLWGYRQVNYDPGKLSELVCRNQNWKLVETRFYSGIPGPIHPVSKKADKRRVFWDNKIKSMKSNGVTVYTRELRYVLENGVCIEREKGIDVRIAIDAVMSMVYNRCDVALIFSQDQDLNEVAREIRSLSDAVSRWMKVASAFPCDPSAVGHNNKISTKGIDGTDWCRISRAEYDLCIDPNQY